MSTVQHQDIVLDELPNKLYLTGQETDPATAARHTEQAFADAAEVGGDEPDAALGTLFRSDTGSVTYSFVVVLNKPNEVAVSHWQHVLQKLSNDTKHDLINLESNKAVPTTVRVLGSSKPLGDFALQIQDAGQRPLFTPISCAYRNENGNKCEKDVGYPMMLLNAEGGDKRVLRQAHELSSDHSQVGAPADLALAGLASRNFTPITSKQF